LGCPPSVATCSVNECATSWPDSTTIAPVSVCYQGSCTETYSKSIHDLFYTDQYVVYEGVIPAAQHRAINKLTRKTNYIERFNNTLRQRVSRLVREALSFSKQLANHIGAIKLFICHYNPTRAVA
jgi:IS1 transposase